MAIARIILVAGGFTHSLGALENLKSIHVHFQTLMICNDVRNQSSRIKAFALDIGTL